MPTLDPSPITLEEELFDILGRERAIFRALERRAVDALWIGDPDDPRRSWVSARFWTILGHDDYDSALRAGFDSWRDLADVSDLAAFDAAVAGSSSSSSADEGDEGDEGDAPGVQPVCHVVRFRHADGYEVATEVWGLRCASPMEPGRRRLIGFHKNLDQRIQLQRLFDETNRAARIGAWSWNVVTGKIQWTRLIYEIHEIDDPNYEPALTSGINFYREGHSRETITAAVQRCLADGTPWDLSLELVTAKGNFRWVRAIGQAERVDGKCVRVYGSFQDIHAQRLRDIQLARSEALLSENFALAPNGMLIAGPNGRIERVSNSLAELLGYPVAGLLGRRLPDLMHPDDRAADEALLASFSDGRRSRDRREKRLLTSDGEIVWADVAAAAIRDEDGAFTKLSVQLVDISEAKAAEAYRMRVAFLEDKAREMEQFAYIASHDLRQPVLTLKGYLQALKEDFGTEIGPDGNSYIAVMEAAAARMDNMIRGLLDYSRISQTRELEEVDLPRVVDEIVSDLESLRAHTDGTFEVGPLPTVLGYEIELRQVFQNLLANALKFARPGVPPVVGVDAARVRGGYEFAVADNGIGIRATDRERIFGLFQRGQHTTDQVDGSGIGLATCKAIVERHGGTIGVTSEPGAGSTFTFSLLTDRFR